MSLLRLLADAKQLCINAVCYRTQDVLDGKILTQYHQAVAKHDEDRQAALRDTPLIVLTDEEGDELCSLLLEDIVNATPHEDGFTVSYYDAAGEGEAFLRVPVFLQSVQGDTDASTIIRLQDILARLCQAVPPMVAVQTWLATGDADLQDWVSNTNAPSWLSAIDVLELALTAADVKASR